jgi:diphthamide biosynthesis protein 7
MYDGARIVEHNETFNVMKYFKNDHESMVYGCDWSLDGDRIASCSFYDNVIQIWSANEIEKPENNRTI